MKKIFVFSLILICCSYVLAEQSVTYHRNMPEGTFKAKKNGDIIHYDKKGKKIGIYKAAGRKYVKIK